ncbi:ABC transporter permease [Clostridium mediterraneense]|uniref:ABC transporter permease n=1 Tax=Clostridium mediterraneense TaxID=1805472 RepID=UPI00082B209B|nr:ABC transporter permease [Clostridium mediterraneense]
MYFKIAKNNVVKSFKDYTIYFLTLSFAVCIFYAFNSIGAQQAMLDLSRSQKEYIELIQMVMSYLSIFVSIILGCLIIYANNFLIKKRKKELAVYMILGMGKTKVSRILLLETIFIGLLSLVIGIVIGIFVSQGLSIITSNLFEVSMSRFEFIISGEAILKTIIYFAVIYLLVMIFNVVVVSKYKLLDLLTAERKNESIKIKNTIISFIVFILGVGALVSAYIMISLDRLESASIFGLSILLGFVGTFLFFFGLSGFLVFIAKRNKKFYYKRLNSFVVRQINNRINTNFVSMSLISLMLFITIVALSTGVSFKNSLEQSLKRSTPFDVSLYAFNNSDSKMITDTNTIKSTLEKKHFKVMPGDKYEYFTVYRAPIEFANEQVKLSSFGGSDIDVMSLTDYNKIRELEGKSPVTLENQQAILLCNFDQNIKIFNNALAKTKQVEVGNKKYTIKNDKIIDEALMSTQMSMNTGTIIVPDADTKDLEYSMSGININYSSSDMQKDEEYYSNFLEHVNDKINGQYIEGTTRQMAYSENQGIIMTILYIVIYLGIIFLITSAAVLALQQLSEASDNVERYSALRKIGATNEMISKTIFEQIFIYFMTPLILAIVDSIVAINVASEFINMFGEASIFVSSIMVLMLIIIIYGGYFYSTYVGVKNIVKEK